jgi:hypothetical protein
MKKNYLILTDALTYNGIKEQINQADVGIFRLSDLGRIKSFLFDHWNEIQEVHLYKEGTKVGLDWLTGGNLKLANSEPNRVNALYGQVKVILTVNCNKGVDPSYIENWDNGSCTFNLTLVAVKKPKLACDDPDEFLEGTGEL